MKWMILLCGMVVLIFYVRLIMNFWVLKNICICCIIVVEKVRCLIFYRVLSLWSLMGDGIE